MTPSGSIWCNKLLLTYLLLVYIYSAHYIYGTNKKKHFSGSEVIHCWTYQSLGLKPSQAVANNNLTASGFFISMVALIRLSHSYKTCIQPS